VLDTEAAMGSGSPLPMALLSFLSNLISIVVEFIDRSLKLFTAQFSKIIRV